MSASELDDQLVVRVPLPPLLWLPVAVGTETCFEKPCTVIVVLEVDWKAQPTMWQVVLPLKAEEEVIPSTLPSSIQMSAWAWLALS